MQIAESQIVADVYSITTHFTILKNFFH